MMPRPPHGMMDGAGPDRGSGRRRTLQPGPCPDGTQSLSRPTLSAPDHLNITRFSGGLAMDAAPTGPAGDPLRSTILRQDDRESSSLADPLAAGGLSDLADRYRAILDAPRLDWTEYHRLT